MFLKNISLRHFKCHEELYIDFNTSDDRKLSTRKTTFLVGENGTGKSALLQAIAIVTGGSEALRSLPGFPDNFIQAGKDSAEITATITTAQGEERPLSLLLNRGEGVFAAVERARTTLAPMDAALRHTHRSYFTAGYGSGRRLSANEQWVGDIHALVSPRYAAVRSLFGRDALLRPLYAWIEELQYKGDAHIEALGNALNTFLPESVRFHSYAARERALLFKTVDGVLPLELLSNGYQQTIAWVSDLLYHVTHTFGDYKAPLSARGLLLVDEIDLHMHPSWQRQVYAFLQQGLPNFQVIATTHSPLTAQQARPDELYILSKDADGKTELHEAEASDLEALQQLQAADTAMSFEKGGELLWHGAGIRARSRRMQPDVLPEPALQRSDTDEGKDIETIREAA